ncbi:MAG: CatB-related O-acetyltransferase [Candidatus Nanohalobium sp.]
MSLLEYLKRPFRAKILGSNNNSSISLSAKVFRGTELSSNSRIGPFCDVSPETEVGRWTNLTERVITRGEVNIGSFCAVGPEVWMQGHNHDLSRAAVQKRWQNKILENNYQSQNGKVEIGDNVWIGARAIILPGVRISDHAVIGAGSVVTKDVEQFEVVGGSPAKHIRYRFNKKIREKIKSLDWTNMSIEEIKSREEFFKRSLNK